MKLFHWIISVVVILILIFSVTAFFEVTEGQEALVLRFGRIHSTEQGPIVYAPGLHFRIPFLETVKRFDTRLQTLVVESSRVLTAEQKYLLVDYYARWRISNLAQFYKSTGGLSLRADRLLAQKINDGMRAEFGRRTITEVVSNQRIDVMSLSKKQVMEVAEGLGIEVVDVRINRIDLPSDVSQSVFARMSAEREQVAAKHRADGRSAGEAIRAQADATVTVTLATAESQAAAIRAKGQSEAAAIYQKAYAQDLPFYNFYKSLQVYHSVFHDKRDVIVLSTDNALLKYFKDDQIQNK